MTTEKREPFARTVEDEGNVWVCVGQKIVNQFAQGEGLIVANNLESALNAAFNARVDAEVQKAVGEFRSRSIDRLKSACVDCCGDGYVRVSSHGCNGDDRRCLTTCPIEGLAECRTCGTTIDLILSLPTEPGKGE